MHLLGKCLDVVKKNFRSFKQRYLVFLTLAKLAFCVTFPDLSITRGVSSASKSYMENILPFLKMKLQLSLAFFSVRVRMCSYK